MMAAALAVTGAAAEAVVYTYDGDFIADPGGGLPGEIDLTFTLPDTLFQNAPATTVYEFSYTRGTGGNESFFFEGVEFDGAGVLLPAPIVAADQVSAFRITFNAFADVSDAIIYYRFGSTEYIQELGTDSIEVDGADIGLIGSNDYARTGDPLPSSPTVVPLPASVGFLALGVAGLAAFRRRS